MMALFGWGSKTDNAEIKSVSDILGSLATIKSQLEESLKKRKAAISTCESAETNEVARYEEEISEAKNAHMENMTTIGEEKATHASEAAQGEEWLKFFNGVGAAPAASTEAPTEMVADENDAAEK